MVYHPAANAGALGLARDDEAKWCVASVAQMNIHFLLGVISCQCKRAVGDDATREKWREIGQLD